MFWFIPYNGAQYTQVLRSLIILTCVLLFISCSDFSVISNHFCDSLNTKMEDSKICSSLSSKEYKINLKGLMNTKAGGFISKLDSKEYESITHLDLSNNPDLTQLPSFVYKMPNLIELDISNTKISDWGTEICSLKKLRKLIGTHNNYQNGEIPFNTFCVENLQILNMSHSNIKYLDEYIGKLQKLKELRLRNNQILIVPLMVQQLPEISVIDFRNNFFKDDKINTLHNCNFISDEKEQKCREEMLETMSCIFYYEVPFLRGDPLRKMYTDLSGQNLDKFESVDADKPMNEDQCYTSWLVWMIDYEESPDFLEKTIRGKTLRELRYMSPYQNEHVNPFTCYSVDWPLITDEYEPKKMGAFPWEIFPEEFREPGAATQFLAWWKGDHFWIPVKECPHLVGLKEHVQRKQEQINKDSRSP